MKKEFSCPSCSKISSLDEDNPWRPFCSERCRLVDLGEWLDENNRIASEDAEFFTSNTDDDEFRH